MTQWGVALTAIALAALVFAQDIVPTWAGFHTWQYAGVVAVLMIFLVTSIGPASKARDGEADYPLLLVLTGALIVGAAGLASGLLGPDTVTITRAPGTVTPLPDLGAAAFFPNADAQSIASESADILLRRRDRAELVVGAHGRVFLGSYALEEQPHIAAYVDARDGRGNHLTVTQPTGTAFLSPVLLFPGTVLVQGQSLPDDNFAAPAVHRRVQAMYFSPEAARSTRVHQMVGDRPSILFVVDDDQGHLVSGGLGVAADGVDALVGGVKLRPAIGFYPALVISAVPAPLALIVGGVALLAGLGWGLLWQARKLGFLSKPVIVADK